MVEKIEEITLILVDKKEFIINKQIAMMSPFIKNLIEDLECTSIPINYKYMTSDILASIIKYLEYYNTLSDDYKKNDIDLDHNMLEGKNILEKKSILYKNLKNSISEFELNFLDKDVFQLKQILLASNYLGLEYLVKLCCKKLAYELLYQDLDGCDMETISQLL